MKFFLLSFCFGCLYMILPDTQATVYSAASININPVIRDSVPHKRSNYKIITNTDHSYGYNVFVNGKLLVHQPVIPGIQGVKGFTRKGDAQKVASLVLKKVQEGLIPPTISNRELDSLSIKY